MFAKYSRRIPYHLFRSSWVSRQSRPDRSAHDLFLSVCLASSRAPWTPETGVDFRSSSYRSPPLTVSSLYHLLSHTQQSHGGVRSKASISFPCSKSARVLAASSPVGCRRMFYYEHLQNGVGLDCIWTWRRPGSLCGSSGWISLSLVLDAIMTRFKYLS